MTPSHKLPSISVLIPTLNAAKPLQECLRLIAEQDYPRGKVEVIIADGGSTDSTIAVARRFGAKVVTNKLKTGEAGKAAALKAAKNEIVALIDSDNYLPTKNWLRRMVESFADPEIFGSEPIAYTYRRRDGLITRYCALMGMNDPICLFLGNYDRYNYLTGRWTGMDVKSEDRGNYLELYLNKNQIPTIGANGTMIRRKMMQDHIGDYLFDIDEIHRLVAEGHNKFAKVKIGIIHIFSGSVSTFIRKQKRRMRDYAYYQKLGIRRYPWSKLNKFGLLKFTVYSGLWLPTLGQALVGFMKKPDKAWFFHPLASWLTLWIYGTEKIKQKVLGVQAMTRGSWRQ